MKNYKTIFSNGRELVVRYYERSGKMAVNGKQEDVPTCNFLGISNLMLCGRLGKGETLQQWLTAKESRLNKRQLFD